MTLPEPTRTLVDDEPIAREGMLSSPGDPELARSDSRLVIKDGRRVVFLRTEEIDWIEAADYYVQIHVGGKSYLHRETMMSLERRLGGEQFVRIHRSAIVNRRRIRELSSSRRAAVVVLEGGATLRVSRSQRDKLAALRG